ncbi:N-acetylmuramoyl-L-alanine amidase [bacterium]|nr:N-acetylmuramoyl-L-alanine amidase [bacterium]
MSVSSTTLQCSEGYQAEIDDGKYIYGLFETQELLEPCLYDSDNPRSFFVNDRKLYRVPYEALLPHCQRVLFLNLFPDDYCRDNFWYHRVQYVGTDKGGENLYRVALWLTGSGRNYKKLAAVNPDREHIVRIGDIIKIPVSLLIPAFLENDRVASKNELSVPDRSDNEDTRAVSREAPLCIEGHTQNSDLTYSSDDRGRYALYRLKKGEALYSAVIMRFTGRILAIEVNALAAQVAERSDIIDVTDIPIGFGIKIPLELLTPEYLPPDDQRYQDYIKNRQTSQEYARKVSAHDLTGVHVIIDSGHGGNDPGALGYYQVVEDEYVYDIACRLRRILLQSTHAEVAFTNYDPHQGYSPRNRASLASDRNEYLLTNPHFRNTDSTRSAHLRWFLANTLYNKWLAAQKHSDRIVFLSLHADALHPSANGSMLYIPAAEMCKGSYTIRDSFYKQFAEVKNGHYGALSSRERYQSEAYSLRLATHILQEMKQLQIPIHARKPIREFIIRKNKSWVPAVLHYNAIPTKILIEVANLKNKEDCKRLKSPEFRESLAKAIAAGIQAYYN